MQQVLYVRYPLRIHPTAGGDAELLLKLPVETPRSHTALLCKFLHGEHPAGFYPHILHERPCAHVGHIALGTGKFLVANAAFPSFRHVPPFIPEEFAHEVVQAVQQHIPGAKQIQDITQCKVRVYLYIYAHLAPVKYTLKINDLPI